MGILHSGFPSCHPINNVNALKKQAKNKNYTAFKSFK